MLNTALIGFGYWGNILKKYLDESPKFKLRYICFRSARQGGVFISDINKIWEDSSIDVVIIAIIVKTSEGKAAMN